MARKPHPNCYRPLILFCVHAILSAAAYAQVSFVQITDPHVFDDVKTAHDKADAAGPTKAQGADALDNRLDDKAALAFCIDKINQRVLDNGTTYDFVVVTGDLGIEQLVRDADGKGDDAIEERIRGGASYLASVLVLSRVGRWLFVPGNNDVVGERPEKVRYYHQFLKALADEIRKTRADFEIIDLCPRYPAADGGVYDSRAGIFQIPGKTD
jgi:hypothetical protein